MSIVTCPTDVVAASPQRVWALVSDPLAVARWSGCRLREGPLHAPPLVAGDALVLGAGFAGLFSVRMDIRDAEPLSHLRVDVWLPFGIENRELVAITPLSPQSCRVTFN